MSYRRALLTRWSRRDRYAVVMVAVAVAFLTGTTLVVVAVGSSTTAIVGETDIGPHATSHPSMAAATDAAGPDALVLPVSEVRVAGETTHAIGVPPDARLDDSRLRAGGTTRGPVAESAERTLRGPAGTATVSAAPRASDVFPPTWYVTDAATVERLGVTEVLVVAPSDGVPAEGVPLETALAFFLAGTRQALATLGVAAGVGAILVGVTVHSVTRMTIRDRSRELYVLRATGTSRWQVHRLFLARGTLLVGVGVAGGYALGVISTTVAVNAAVAAGVPTSLSTGVTDEVVRFLLPTYLGVVVVAWAATIWAVHPVVSGDPATITDEVDPVRPGRTDRHSLLSLRTAVPTTATLAAFVTFLLVVAGFAGAAAPLAASDDATITAPDSPHPIASQVPAAYADPLTDRGIAASPEILLFAVHESEPYVARGAEWEAFADVSDATLVTGRAPTGQTEAVIGTDLAETLGVEVGETLLLGGSVRRAVARVSVVGTFDGPGATDDQLVVGLDTARHLTNVGDGRVQFIRADRLPSDEGGAQPVAVTGLEAPGESAAGDSINVTVTLRNDGLQRRTVRRTVRFGESTERIELSIPPNAERTATATFTPTATGTTELRIGDRRRMVEILDPDALRIRGLPERAPVDSQPRLRVVDASGESVENATVSAGNWTGRTGDGGYVRVPIESAGTVEVTVATDERRTSTTVRVGASVDRRLQASLTVTPGQPSFTDRPRLEVTLSNPWNRTLERTLSVSGAGADVDRTRSVGPGETVRFEVDLPRRQPGTYELTLRSEMGALATTSYEVTGDERVVAALATSGRSGTTGIGQAAAVALGNLELALAVLLLLGAGMTVGGTGAAFAGAIHANRRTIGVHRAIGATRTQIARIVLRDALRVGGIAVVAALGLGWLTFALLGRVGVLTVYGVRMQVGLDWALVGGVVLGSLLVVLLGAGVATASVLADEPADLLRGAGRR